MITAKDIIDFMESYAPGFLAFDGDNVGLIVGRGDKPVARVLLTLDVDEAVALEAKQKGADMIISHHPLMFHAIKRLTEADPMQRCLRSLVAADISIYSAHTNLDCVKNGLNDFLAKKLGITNTSVIEVVSTYDGNEHGFGRVGIVPQGTTVLDMLQKCKVALGAEFLRYVGDTHRQVTKVALNCGGGADEIDICIANGVDLFITGDVKYNPARDSYENKMALIDAGHYETEHIVCELFEDILSEQFAGVDFVVSEANTPVFKCYK